MTAAPSAGTISGTTIDHIDHVEHARSPGRGLAATLSSASLLHYRLPPHPHRHPQRFLIGVLSLHTILPGVQPCQWRIRFPSLISYCRRAHGQTRCIINEEESSSFWKIRARRIPPHGALPRPIPTGSLPDSANLPARARSLLVAGCARRDCGGIKHVRSPPPPSPPPCALPKYLYPPPLPSGPSTLIRADQIFQDKWQPASHLRHLEE